jgi:hypothetical protein
MMNVLPPSSEGELGKHGRFFLLVSTITQAGCRRFPNAAVRVPVGSGHVGYFVDKAAPGHVFT